MILFLDYDGVLHPDPCTEARRLFENAPRLAEVLADFPEVGVVLSTSWRHAHSEEETLGGLPATLRERVLGKTPRYSDFVVARHPYHRHAECEQWLRDQGMTASPWWALDDRADWFAPYCENLLHCHAECGFDDAMGRRLSTALSIARQRAQREVDFALT